MPTEKLVEKIRQIENHRCSLNPEELRLHALKFGLGVTLDKPTEYAIVTGCRSASVFVHLAAVVKLLRHYGLDHTFLSTESCCGNSLSFQMQPEENPDDLVVFEENARKFEAGTIAKIKELGIKKLVTVCPGCNTRYNQFQGGGDIEILYYTQLLVPLMKGLRLDASIDFYEGCHKPHRTPNFKIDTQSARTLLESVEGLKVNYIPNYCCKTFPDKICDAAKTGTIFTPTSCCYQGLITRKTSDSIQVRFLTEILCQAAEIA